MKKKILIDLDVVTIAFWDKNKEALEFLERVKKGEFEVYTPHIVLDLLANWKYIRLKNKIIRFYKLYTKENLGPQKILEKFENFEIEKKGIADYLVGIGVKRDDATLAMITSIFDVDMLITYNRKHLRGKVNEINEVLDKNGLRKINILLPNVI
jgi:predicted nucleic acid-binding protein